MRHKFYNLKIMYRKIAIKGIKEYIFYNNTNV